MNVCEFRGPPIRLGSECDRRCAHPSWGIGWHSCWTIDPDEKEARVGCVLLANARADAAEAEVARLKDSLRLNQERGVVLERQVDQFVAEVTRLTRELEAAEGGEERLAHFIADAVLLHEQKECTGDLGELAALRGLSMQRYLNPERPTHGDILAWAEVALAVHEARLKADKEQAE